jgi:hypothetical protein
VQKQRLEDKLSAAQKELRMWLHFDEKGSMRHAVGGLIGTRRAKTPEEREELKQLEAAVIDARTRLLLHENDGRML